MSSRNATSPRPIWKANPAKRRLARWWERPFAALAIWSLLAGALFSSGCSDAQLDSAVKNVFTPGKSPQQYMLVAVSDDDPDLRRDAVAKIAKSKQYNKDWAIKGYVAIALLETDTQARCVAVRALARTGEPQAVETLLKILNYRDEPPQTVRNPEDLCRWDAANGLADLSAANKVPEASRAAVRKTLLVTLKTDPARNVRAAAARGLGYYPEAETVEGLIKALRDQDFTVVHQCEESLVRLTGNTQNCSATAWQEWYEAHQGGLFAQSGQIPATRRMPYQNGWEKMNYDANQFLDWMAPPTGGK